MEARRAEQYDAMAVHHATVTCFDRKRMDTSSVRYMNNFVKACMIDTACRTVLTRLPSTRVTGLVIADVACGRGQDVSKWKFGSEAAGSFVHTYYAIDLSEHDCGAASTLASRFVPRASRIIHSANMGTDAFEMPPSSVHILSCQLALHYVCDAREHVAHFFQQAAQTLHPDGLMLVSFADGRAIVRRGRNARDGIVVQPFYKLEIKPEVLRARLPSAFGNMYVFTLEDSVLGVPEYLCHEGAVSAVAAAHGLFPQISKAFDELARFLKQQARFKEIARKMDGSGFENAVAVPATLDVANLYRFIVMSKQRGATAFTQHLVV